MKSQTSRFPSLETKPSKHYIFTALFATLLSILAIVQPGSASGATSARLGGTCSSELKWASIPASMENIAGQLICLQTPKGLKWQDPAKLKVDAHLNSILMKCGSQFQNLDARKVDAKLLSSFKLAISRYVTSVLHLRVVRIDSSQQFLNLNVKYYREVGMCTNGIGGVPYYTGPDTRIPAKSNLLWQVWVYCQIGPQTAPLNIAFARVGTTWKFDALGGITSMPMYM